MATGSTTSPRRDDQDGVVPTVLPVPPEAAGAPTRPAGAGRGRRLRRFLLRHLPRYTWSGTVGALLLGYASFTPSLLPRGWLLQGLVEGITAAVGYGLGVFVAWFVREVSGGRGPGAGVRHRAWQVVAVTGPVLGLVALWAGHVWQGQIHRLMGLEPPSAQDALWIVVVALLAFALLVGVARAVLRFARWVVRQLGRVLPARAARPLGVVLAVALVVFLVNGLLLQGLVDAANSAFSLKDHGTEQGAVRPTAPERSGSPESLIPWDGLGLQGRNFVGRGPTTAELSAFSGRPAVEPVRAYAGLASAGSVDERAALAVADLQRAGGFDRKVLVVVTTTGTGWVDPAASDALEYEFDGDTAMVAIQFSYLPSWISFLVDQTKARDAGRTLFDHVYGVWATLPPDHRPELLVYGESLGSFGGEAAFTGLGSIRNQTDGVLWAGPPNFNGLWRGFVAGREPSSPEWLPVYGSGRDVRFADRPADLAGPSGPWSTPRVAYLQNGSDPIVWWTPQLILQPPGWLEGSHAPDVSPHMFWLPFVTFWQVTADMAFAVDVPEGHGHHYAADYVDGWAAVAQPPDWTQADTDRLRRVIG
jgi:uncharacterized membrane protein